MCLNEMMKVKDKKLASFFLTGLLVMAVFAVTCENIFAAGESFDKPQITQVKVYGHHHVRLQWKKLRGNVKYKIYRKKADGKYRLIKTTTKGIYYDRNLAYGTRYAYKVKANFVFGKTKTSKVKIASTKPDKPVIKVELYEKNHVKVKWKKTKGATKYRVYRKKGNGKYKLMKTTSQTIYYDKNLSYDNRYTYKVKAISKDCKTNISEGTSVVTQSKERVVTVKVPVYETKTVYWIKDVTGTNIIYKSTNWEEWGRLLDQPLIVIDGVNYGFAGNYGSGAFDDDGDGLEDEKYKIIIDYNIYTMTETEWKTSYWNGYPGVVSSFHGL